MNNSNGTIALFLFCRLSEKMYYFLYLSIYISCFQRLSYWILYDTQRYMCIRFFRRADCFVPQLDALNRVWGTDRHTFQTSRTFLRRHYRCTVRLSVLLQLRTSLCELTGSGKSKTDGGNRPEVFISQLVDLRATKFRRLYLCFGSSNPTPYENFTVQTNRKRKIKQDGGRRYFVVITSASCQIWIFPLRRNRHLWFLTSSWSYRFPRIYLYKITAPRKCRWSSLKFIAITSASWGMNISA